MSELVYVKRRRLLISVFVEVDQPKARGGRLLERTMATRNTRLPFFFGGGNELNFGKFYQKGDNKVHLIVFYSIKERPA